MIADASARPAAPGPRRAMNLARREERAFYLFILPWILGFLVFWAIPMLASIVLSFTRWNMVGDPAFYGTRNFEKMFADPLFWQSLKVTSIWVFGSVPLHQIVALTLALLLNKRVPGMGVFRTLFYLPSVVSGVGVALMWMWLLNPYFGLVNYVLDSVFQLPGPQWLASEQWALPGLILMSIWQVGMPMVVYLAGLQGIPGELYEAASIDGADDLTKFRQITLPLLSPVILFNLVIGIIGSFQVFTQALVMTGGGPNNATLFYVLYLYRNAFQYFEMGYASALAWVLFVIIMTFTLVQFKLAGSWVHYEGGPR